MRFLNGVMLVGLVCACVGVCMGGDVLAGGGRAWASAQIPFKSGDLITAERIFKTLDDNKDGLIEKADVQVHHKEFFDFIDRNKNGFITLKEAQLASRPVSRFHDLDRDQDKKVSFDESVALEMQRFAAADANQDGRVSYDEFMLHARTTGK